MEMECELQTYISRRTYRIQSKSRNKIEAADLDTHTHYINTGEKYESAANELAGIFLLVHLFLFVTYLLDFSPGFLFGLI